MSAMVKPNLRCPHCSEQFHSEGTGGTAKCPKCQRSFSAPSLKLGALKRTCPSCGERYSGPIARCPACGVDYRDAKEEKFQDTQGPLAPERAGIRKGVLGGIAMIVIAVIWFVLGHMAGRIFIYPPILAVIGIFAVVRGLSEGNLAGENSGKRGRRPR